MKTLVINTYGGSLLVGAQALGLEIIGSYEDTGFGMPIQQANFPRLDFRPFRKDWPVQDLSETFVIAHPPCSAFSVQNNNPERKGVNSSAFACTKSVLQYCVDNKAVGFAIESVVGALAGAWHIHQEYADKYGYNIYRILENGTMFGAQWRDRFWVVYLKKGAAPDLMPWTIRPNWQNVQDVITGYEDGPSPAGLDEALEKLKGRFINEAHCTPEDLEWIFSNPPEMESVDGRLWERKFKNQIRWEVCKQYVTKYASSAMVQLAPQGFCPVLLGSSWWFTNGRNLSERAYKRLMGFPADYIFPEGDTGRKKDNYRIDMRTYLSKGVMPPIAAFILENALRHLGVQNLDNQFMHEPGAKFGSPYNLEIMPDMIADFRIRKSEWGLSTKPALRHEDPHGVARGLIKPLPMPEPTSTSVDMKVPPVKPDRPPKPVREPRAPRIRRSRTPWNAPELEDSLKETLFVRPHTADAYALYESHGYHRMGVRAGDVVLDLGAHIGCVASRAALVGAAKIVCVEAEPENFELLQQNTRTFPQVEAIHGAVWGGDAQNVQLHRVKRRDDGGHSTGTHSCLFTTHGDTIPIPRVDFRELLNEYQPTVIKCDTEGAEFSLDWTNLPESVRSVGMEYHTRRDQNRDKAKAIHQILEAQGFKPVHRLNLESNFSAIVAFYSRERTNETGASE